MDYQLAQINIARFRLPIDHPVNLPFVESLDRVNAIAEAQPGFVWRLTGEGNDALDLKAFDDPNIAINLTVWTDPARLSDFVYRSAGHAAIMKRRAEWFDRIDTHMALWWIEAGHRPTIQEALAKLEQLQNLGPTAAAFTFRKLFPAPAIGTSG